MSKKKAPQVKKKRPEKRSITEQFLQVADHVFSYFEILFLYVRKSLNQKIQQSLIAALLLINLTLLNVAGMCFVLYGIFLSLLDLFQQNATSAAFTAGFGLLFLTGIPIIILIRRVSV